MKLIARYTTACVVVVVVGVVLVVSFASFNHGGGLGSRQWRDSSVYLSVVPKEINPTSLFCSPGFHKPDGKECQPCPSGTVSVPPMITRCVQKLTCGDIKHLLDESTYFASGGVKQFSKKTWNYSDFEFVEVLVAKPHSEFDDDFLMGIQNLADIGPHSLIVTPLGSCDDPPALVTPFFRNGNAQNVESIALQLEDEFEFRSQLVEDYASILLYLHKGASNLGAYVMCDGVSVKKLLSQFLISDDFHLILTDVDALPLAQGKRIKCGHRQLIGDFVAPEQRWPYPDQPYQDEKMPFYDEKVDIWRVPEMIETLMGCTSQRQRKHCPSIAPYLDLIRGQCKRLQPDTRPDASWIYRTIKKMRYTATVTGEQHNPPAR